MARTKKVGVRLASIPLEHGLFVRKMCAPIDAYYKRELQITGKLDVDGLMYSCYLQGLSDAEAALKKKE